MKAANLLTPDMVSEFEELEYLVQRETGRSQEPAGTLGGSEVTPAQEEQQHSDNGELVWVWSPEQLGLNPYFLLSPQDLKYMHE